MRKSIRAMSLLAGLAGLGLAPGAQAVDVKFAFNFMDTDARINGYFIVDDSVLAGVYNHGTPPADGGLIDFSKVKELNLHYQPGEYASGGGDFTLADYSSLMWTSDVPVDFYAEDIVWDWQAKLGTGAFVCGSAGSSHVAFAFGRASGSGAPTAMGSTCMAGTEPDVVRVPSLMNLYLDTSYVPPTPVPEPSTYALMLAGLGIVGWSARRRQG
jgi:hypothetical protein